MIGGGEQIWIEQNLAAQWDLDAGELGDTGTGMGIGDEASERLVLPGKAQLLAYAADSFAAFDALVAGLTPEQLVEATRPPDTDPRTVQEAIIGHLAHDNRHLGMIEALRGVLGLKGSATI